jgi:serine/threonine-protein kinase HipA
MKRTIQVCLGDDGRVIGDLRYDRQGARESAAFSYADSWLTVPDRFAIDPALRLVPGYQFHKQVAEGSLFHGVIADCQPDGWGRTVILRDQAKRRSSSRAAGTASMPPIMGEMDFLLAVDDFSRLGALRFRDEEGNFQARAGAGQRRAPPLLEVGLLMRASRAIETSTETESDLAYLRGHGTSLGGLRPKCALIDEDGSLAIGKFPSVSDQRAVTKGEVLAMRLAHQAGIHVADARLIESDGCAVAVIRRFDRLASGGRIAYCSAATLLGVDRRDTDQHSYSEIADAIRINGAEAQDDIEQLWRRIAFSIAINNVDDHLRNHGFLYAGNRRWRLSPAFDINPFPERARELKTWISEDSGPAATMEILRSAAPHFRVSRKRAERIIAEITSSVARWRTVGADLGMTKGELERFADAFEPATS